MEELKKKITRLVGEIDDAASKVNLDKLVAQHSRLTKQMAAGDFWADSQKAQDISRQEAVLAKRIAPWQDLQAKASELSDLAQLGDESLQPDIVKQAEHLSAQLEELKAQLRFSGPYDDKDVIISIHAGAGGTDAQDWAQMLLRMYVRWAEAHKLTAKTISQSAGEEAGIKSADFQISGGEFLYGKLAGEHGVHRLVRLSPYNANNLRQTSFAKVEVLPLIIQPGDVQIDDKDLKIDVYRAGGRGGQSVNTTDSAVRVTHLPTGVNVAIQNERSQLQNKETALQILRSKLVQLQLEQHAQDLASIKGPSQSAEWGNQIRSYVLHPYKQIKDLRTGYESSEVEKVLDGALDPVIDAWLARA